MTRHVVILTRWCCLCAVFVLGCAQQDERRTARPAARFSPLGN